MTRGGVPWKPPTRRAFLAMLAAGGAAVTVLPGTPAREPAGQTDAPKAPSLWIGHC